MKYLTNSGLSYFLNKIKAYIASQLNSKASAIHTHTKSDIIDLPNGYVVDSTLDGTSSNAISNSAVVDALDGKSNTGHTHTKSDITDFPTLATVATSGSYNDLSNKPTTMTPTSHTHGNITNDGKIGSNANKPLITTTGGTVTTGSFGTTANTFCQGNDSRLSDARTPTAHTHNASDITSGLATVATSGSYNDLSNKPTIPTVNNATLTIQKNGTTVKTFTANASSNVTANITVPTKTSDLTNDSGFITGVTWNDVSNKPSFATVATSGSYNDLSNKPTIPTTLESLSTNSIPFHNAYPRCKYLGNSITDAQNTAIKNRTYDDLFIGDYWTINGVTWRIVAIDYYYNVGDTNFDKGNVIVMPDTVLYNAQMNETNTTAGAYAGSLMRTQNLNNARTIAQNAFGSHLANHRILLANSVDTSGPGSWDWHGSDGVELPNEVQIYGTRVWGSALKGFDVATQKQQFPLLALAPQFVNIRQNYWLQDVSSFSVSSAFAYVYLDGPAGHYNASLSSGVRPSVTLSYI